MVLICNDNDDDNENDNILVDDVYTPPTDTSARDTSAADPSDPFLVHCAQYATRLLTVPGAAKIGVPGRVASKQRLRKPLDDALHGTPALRQKDVDVFVDMVSDPATQRILGAYLQALSGAGKTNK